MVAFDSFAFMQHGNEFCHTASVCIAALGDTSARAFRIFGHIPEAYCWGRRVGYCTQWTESKAWRTISAWQRMPLLWFVGMRFLFSTWHPATLWITTAKTRKTSFYTGVAMWRTYQAAPEHWGSVHWHGLRLLAGTRLAEKRIRDLVTLVSRSVYDVTPVLHTLACDHRSF